MLKVLLAAAILGLAMWLAGHIPPSAAEQAPANPASTKDTTPYCTPANSSWDTIIDKCQDPPAPPQNQPQPTWALDRDHMRDQPGTAVICARPLGHGIVSEYWPHTPESYQQAVKDCS